jgi:hypothetical protein
MANKVQKFSTAPLNWKEVWYTNCPVVSASNVDEALGWTRDEYRKLGVKYAYFRSVRENDWYPHYIHNLDNLIRFGGLYPPIHVQADIRRTRLLGATPVYEGGCMLVRAKDRIYKMSHLKGKRIGLSKSLNTLKNDWWRITEHYGILNMLMLNDMTRMDDVEIVEFPYADDWYADPKLLEPFEQRHRALHGQDGPQAHTSPTARWRRRCSKARSMRSTPTARPGSICRRTPERSRRSRTCRGIRTGPCSRATCPP